MALFGAPITHEDHARRAVLAALELQRTLQAQQAALGGPYGVACTVRAGLNSGMVVVGATIPANGPYTLCDDDVGAICGRSDINLTLLSMPKRLNRSAGRAENRPQASSEHTSPVTTGNRRVVRLASQTDE